MELTGAKTRAFSAHTKQWKAKVSKGNEITKSILSVSGEKRESFGKKNLHASIPKAEKR